MNEAGVRPSIRQFVYIEGPSGRYLLLANSPPHRALIGHFDFDVLWAGDLDSDDRLDLLLEKCFFGEASVQYLYASRGAPDAMPFRRISHSERQGCQRGIDASRRRDKEAP